MFFQNLIGTVLLLPFILKDLKNTNIFNKLITSKNCNLHLLRIIIAIFGIALWYFSLTKMPVPQVVAISFISPILTIIGASILLKEKISFNRHIAIFLSLTGGFLITRPDLAINLKLFDWVAIFPICATLIFAADNLITKKLFIFKECPKLTTIYLLLLITPCSLVFALLNNSFVIPVTSNFLPLLALGFLGALAHFSFNKSLETAEITLIMPYGITKLIFNSILSYLVFTEIPQTFSIWLGITIISLSTILLLKHK
jgi:drug/metabolite transporter (DMT)-like permease